MDRCMICRARLRDEPICGRCGTDLTMALAIERQSEDWQRKAVARLTVGDVEGAEHAAKQSLELMRSQFTTALTGLIDSLQAGGQGTTAKLENPE